MHVDVVDPYIENASELARNHVPEQLKGQMNARRSLPGEILSWERVISAYDAVVVATAHKEFIMGAHSLVQSDRLKVVVDGRNCLDAAMFEGSGIIYKGIGR